MPCFTSNAFETTDLIPKVLKPSDIVHVFLRDRTRCNVAEGAHDIHFKP